MNNVVSGKYSLILQGAVTTNPISLTAYSWDIEAALRDAANQIPLPGTVLNGLTRECSDFQVTQDNIGLKTIKLTVLFRTENTKPLTLLSVYEPLLVGT